VYPKEKNVVSIGPLIVKKNVVKRKSEKADGPPVVKKQKKTWNKTWFE
jgi:hypothetical protein